MQHNLQDQRFQKILSLWVPAETLSTFQTAQTKVLRVHPKPGSPFPSQWLPKLPPTSPSLLYKPLYFAAWDCAEEIHGSDQEDDLSGGLSFLSAGSVQSCSCPAGMSQGWHRAEKNRQEKGASLHKV